MHVLENNTATAAQPRGKPASKPRRPRRERARYNGRTAEYFRVKTLEAGFWVQLTNATDPIMEANVTRAAELTALSELIRGQRLRGEAVSVEEIVRIENAARRAVADLGIKSVPQRDAGQTLDGYLEQRYGKHAEQRDEDDETDDTDETVAASPVGIDEADATSAPEDETPTGELPVATGEAS